MSFLTKTETDQPSFLMGEETVKAYFQIAEQENATGQCYIDNQYYPDIEADDLHEFLKLAISRGDYSKN